MKNLGIYQKEIAACRDRLEEALCATLPRVVINGKDTHRLPNTSSLCIPGIEGDALLLRLNDRGIYASAGSACAAGVMAPSHVLLAMGRTAAQARSAIRFSLAQNTSPAEIDIAANTILATIEAMR